MSSSSRFVSSLSAGFDTVLLNQHGIKITRKAPAFLIRWTTMGELQMPYDSHTDFEQLKTPQASETKEAAAHPSTSQFGVERGEMPYL